LPEAYPPCYTRWQCACAACLCGCQEVFDLTFVEYEEGDVAGKLLALFSLAPV
jgi:hypothetical protein